MKVEFAEEGKSENLEKKNPRRQIEIGKSQPTYGAQDLILGRNSGRHDWWPLHQPNSP